MVRVSTTPRQVDKRDATDRFRADRERGRLDVLDSRDACSIVEYGHVEALTPESKIQGKGSVVEGEKMRVVGPVKDEEAHDIHGEEHEILLRPHVHDGIFIFGTEEFTPEDFAGQRLSKEEFGSDAR